jgi:UDP:flavonoid glycosyltransferase YjiC (YdhE family)
MVAAAFNYDQPFWAAQIERLGVGLATSGRQRLGAAELAGAMRRCLEDEGMGARAAAAGKRVRAEDGVSAAVLMIERFLQL